MNVANLVGGLAGAFSLTLIHESVRQISPQAPRVDLIGIKAVRELLNKSDLPIPGLSQQRKLAMGGDLVSNATYYSLAGRSYTRGILLGLAAGLGGVFLPGPLGLGDAEVKRTNTTQLLTIGYYTLAGIVATAVTRSFSKNNKAKKPLQIKLS